MLGLSSVVVAKGIPGAGELCSVVAKGGLPRRGLTCTIAIPIVIAIDIDIAFASLCGPQDVYCASDDLKCLLDIPQLSLQHVQRLAHLSVPAQRE